MNPPDVCYLSRLFKDFLLCLSMVFLNISYLLSLYVSGQESERAWRNTSSCCCYQRKHIQSWRTVETGNYSMKAIWMGSKQLQICFLDQNFYCSFFFICRRPLIVYSLSGEKLLELIITYSMGIEVSNFHEFSISWLRPKSTKF